MYGQNEAIHSRLLLLLKHYLLLLLLKTNKRTNEKIFAIAILNCIFIATFVSMKDAF